MGILIIFVLINSFQNYVLNTYFITSTMMPGVWAYDPSGSTKASRLTFVDSMHKTKFRLEIAERFVVI